MIYVEKLRSARKRFSPECQATIRAGLAKHCPFHLLAGGLLLLIAFLPMTVRAVPGDENWDDRFCPLGMTEGVGNIYSMAEMICMSAAR
jgi:hypothetical protein